MTWAASTFAVPLTLTVPEGWANFAPLPEAVEMFSYPEGLYGVIIFAGDQVIDPTWVPEASDLIEEAGLVVAVASLSTVEEWVQWLSEHPQLEAGEAIPATVGGAEGSVLETTAKGYQIQNCGSDPCVVLLGPYGFGVAATYFISGGGEKARWYVVDVGGKPIVIGAWAESAEQFEDSIEEMDEIVKSIEFAPST